MSILPRIEPEFKGLIPPLTPEERDQLEQNILAARICYDPIVLWEGAIIDGHNRFEICVKHGIEFQIEEIQLDSHKDALVWILENQLSRRNLSDAARIEMALLKAEMLREKAQRNQSKAGGDKKSEGSLFTKSSKPEETQQNTAFEPVNVHKSIAAEAGVGQGTFQRYEQIKEHGSPELLEKVRSGELKIGTAHRLLATEILKQLSLSGKMLKFIKNAMPEEGYEAATPEIHSMLVSLAASMSGLLEKLEAQDHEVA